MDSGGPETFVIVRLARTWPGFSTTPDPRSSTSHQRATLLQWICLRLVVFIITPLATSWCPRPSFWTTPTKHDGISVEIRALVLVTPAVLTQSLPCTPRINAQLPLAVGELHPKNSGASKAFLAAFHEHAAKLHTLTGIRQEQMQIDLGFMWGSINIRTRIGDLGPLVHAKVKVLKVPGVVTTSAVVGRPPWLVCPPRVVRPPGMEPPPWG